MTVRASLTPCRVLLVGRCIALLTVLGMVTPLSAQTPPPEGVAPARNTEADAADAPARPAWRRRAAARDAGVPVQDEGSVSEADATAREAGAPEGRDSEPSEPPVGVEADADREAAEDPPHTDTTDPSAAPTPLAAPSAASEAMDAGVPSEALPDAGPPDASVAAPAALVVDAGVPADAGVLPVVAPVPPPAPTTTFVQVPMPFVPPTEVGDPWEGLREIIPGIPTGGIGPLGLLALLALMALISGVIERLRARLLRDGWLPTLLSFVQVAARLLALLIALALVIQVVPANVRWVVYFILMASGAALGWSMRDVMPDLIAGIVIVFERRIRRGMWIRSDEFSGAVERIGLRSSWLRDSKGHRVAVPNRMLMQIPIVSDEEGDTVQEVVLRLGSKGNAADIRRALRDAVLASPWTTPQCEPQVLRDPVDPELWQVRGRLLSASFASAFQGQLLERAEAHLATLEAKAARPRETTVGEEGAGASPATTKHPKLDKGEKPDKPQEKPPKTPAS
ncbi:MAG: mechanosensitive ion channel [Sandaracinaceae bacterium]|nr:mechanosensitive ion channel [Sandaracinaceae bacterium]MBP7681490.1 mechanosensitive ion channel [Deltaproteobacteria bacterium]MBK6813439.1 mechanosensitive ion channel [Sandaracinaceae bacterium]MBK7152983.1 mechanosensitive ion channel [Sandaracinaceae bacterium]MBK7773575.1 mechanosensitive ion channel [Sandaracinaceae bacterium]